MNLYRVKLTRKTMWGEETIDCCEKSETEQKAIQIMKDSFAGAIIRNVTLLKSDVWF